MGARDRQLGMDRRITRRDFLNGVGVGLGGVVLSELAGADPARDAARVYPPALTGLRGNHPGSFEVAHALAFEGRRWDAPQDLSEERYDLIVVGGGLSGLAAAWFFREAAGPQARILVVDNHDDFGGHAKRNEFQSGALRLAWGGSVNLEYPRYGPDTLQLLEALGVDLERLGRGLEFDFNSLGELEARLYFDADHHGRDVLLHWPDLEDEAALSGWAAALPVSEASRRSLRRFLGTRQDLLADLDREARSRYLRHTSYLDFVTRRAGLTAEAAAIYQQLPHGYWGVGIDALPVSECLALGLPGAHALGELPAEAAGNAPQRFVMFPDGNASLARLLVRALIPGIAPGGTMEDVVAARFDYARLDRPGSPLRVRLRSTAVAARNLADGSGVAVSYVRDGVAERVRAPHCVLACYNNVVPYLCPDLPAEQAEALRYAAKVPLIVSNVLLRRGVALERLKLGSAYSPSRLHAHAQVVGGVSLGEYRWRWDPEAACVVQLYGAVAAPEVGAVARDQHRAGRRRLYEMRFADFEREIRSHLAGLLGAGGLDPAADIQAITVNRWPHGYAYEYNSLSDPDWPPGRAPHEIGRRRFGRIAIANSDAEARAYVDGAIDAARRAVRELATG